ncbi:metallophosphoesterase family protein [Acuticoccus sp. I52.16.1]|uniref:metallophosphoesterase family protein n=1 Tax=Acuticoccus sp. I52.16.1 TaxID=2928472 RepID=UPI001FD00CEA|nr:metallophosphoesterase family protein [Acuticoccus sp. I52.16.1]UOM36451.1 serine/threonine protein phosphatase [Acuticoccus sp. I52.16.1]
MEACLLRFLRRKDQQVHQPAYQPRVASTDRIYAVGDIHGQAHCLDILLDRIDADWRHHEDGRRAQLVLLGDYVDRGADSRTVLDRVAALVDGGAIALRGNHEAAMLGFVNDPVKGANWLQFGGIQTLASYGLAAPRRPGPEELTALAADLAEAMGPHVALLRDKLVNYHTSGDVVFVHADLEPGVDLELQDEAVMLWGDPEHPGATWRADKLVVHGHYADVKPIESEGRLCIDTGAFYTNNLTCVRLDGEVALFGSLGPAPGAAM